MSDKVRAAVAGDVAEAEEIQELLRSAGIDADLEDAEDGAVAVLVADGDLEPAQDALEALTDPDDLIAEP